MPSLPVSFSFLNNVKIILFNIGYHGEFTENGGAILIDDLKLLTFVIGADGGSTLASYCIPIDLLDVIFGVLR